MDQETMFRFASHLTAIFLILMEKGVVTPEEVEIYKVRAESLVDQVVARKKDEARKEVDEKYPGVRDFMKRMFGDAFDE